MASAPPTNDEETQQRAAIERELAEKLREHRDYVATITGSQQQSRSTRPISYASSAATYDSGVVADAPSVQTQTNEEQPSQDAGTASTATVQVPARQEPVNLDNQNAEEQQLEPDENDSDSALGSDTGSITTSLSESIWNYRKEHGRTYHAYKDGKYIFPNDEREADRLDLQHHLLRITYGNKLFFAPLNNPKRCLDVGTGTGIWAIDFADAFPECQVTGTDLSPGQPTMIPPNVKFVIDDAEDLWLYDEKFDFIHVRLMSGCFSDWPNFMRQSFENLEPGGWLELQDYGLPVRSFDDSHLGTDVFKWGQLLCEASLKMGRLLGSDASEQFEQWMKDVGFVDIQVKMFMWPINTWPRDRFMKELGRWNQVNITEGLEGFCLALLIRGLGWQKEEVDILVAKATNDLRNKKIHAYFPMPVVFGRKPFPGEVAFQ